MTPVRGTLLIGHRVAFMRVRQGRLRDCKNTETALRLRDGSAADPRVRSPFALELSWAGRHLQGSPRSASPAAASFGHSPTPGYLRWPLASARKSSGFVIQL